MPHGGESEREGLRDVNLDFGQIHRVEEAPEFRTGRFRVSLEPFGEPHTLTTSFAGQERLTLRRKNDWFPSLGSGRRRC